MTSALASAAEPAAPTASGSWLTQVMRLIGWELFLAWRRRAMVITLSVVFLVVYVIILLLEYAVYASNGDNQGAASGLGEALVWPGAVGVMGEYVTLAGVLLVVVLCGALIGSEYSYATLRLSLARGVKRGQLLSGQIGALAAIALIVVAVTFALGGLVGLLGEAAGVRHSATTATPALFGEIVVYGLAIAVNLFVYALIALWIGTLSRSVAGAIGGPLVYIAVEGAARGILTAVSSVVVNDPIIHLIGQIPNYLLGVNTLALIDLAGDEPYPFTSSPAPFGVAHALIVILVYAAIFVLTGYAVLRARDVRE